MYSEVRYEATDAFKKIDRKAGPTWPEGLRLAFLIYPSFI